MRKITLNRNQILFGALVVTLGLSKSWVQTAEYNGAQADLAQTAPPKDLPQRAQGRGRSGQGQQRPEEGRQTQPASQPAAQPKVEAGQSTTQATTPQQASQASKPVSEVTQEFNVTVNGVTQKVYAKLKNTTSSTTTGGGWDVDANGNIVERLSTTQSQNAIQATFVDTTGCETCLGYDPLTMNTRSLAETESRIKAYLSEQATAKAKIAAEQKAHDDAIKACDEKKVGDAYVSLKKSENRAERIMCLADRVEADEDDKDAVRKFRKAVARDVMKLAQSNDAEDREEAADLLEDLEGKFENDGLERYIKRLASGAKDFNQITELAQSSATNPFAKQYNNQYMDYIAGKWNPAYYQGMTEGTRAAVSDWHNPMLQIARQGIRNPEIIAREYFGGDDDLGLGFDSLGFNSGLRSSGLGLGSDIGLLSGSRTSRSSIGLDRIPSRSRSRTNSRTPYRTREDEYFADDRRYRDDDRYYDDDRRYDDRRRTNTRRTSSVNRRSGLRNI